MRIFRKAFYGAGWTIAIGSCIGWIPWMIITLYDAHRENLEDVRADLNALSVWVAALLVTLLFLVLFNLFIIPPDCDEKEK